jgi:hypothetical protein
MEPSALVADTPRRYYTPWQIAVATILGGSLAGGFLALRNHILFGAPTQAAIVGVLSGVVAIGAIVAGVMMPPHVSRMACAFPIVIAYRWYAESAFGGQISNRKGEGWAQYSWWRVVGISVAFLAGVVLFGIVGILIFGSDSLS